ncbi:MAG: phosphatase PAP2 family protein [Ignavibacteriales bacterium]|nr:phosphatase PAP2 family protein [Ignavibacteriales bacterium]
MRSDDFDQRAVAIDCVSTSFLAGLIAVALLFPSRIPGAADLVLRLAIAGTLHCGLIWTARILPAGRSRAAVRIADLAVLLAFLFDQMQYFQQVLHDSWLDPMVASMEYKLLGTNITVALERFTHPVVTEGMMFAYVMYLPLLPTVAFLLYRSGGDQALHDYLLNLGLMFMVCFIGYIIYPVAGPMFFSPEQYSVPLQGGLFAWCGEWIRHNQHYPGGSVPSAHCAAATGMLIMTFRYHRNLFSFLLPTILIIYLATVYGRYHYPTDSVLGILTALLVIRFSPAVIRGVTLLSTRVTATRAALKLALERRTSGGTFPLASNDFSTVKESNGEQLGVNQ